MKEGENESERGGNGGKGDREFKVSVDPRLMLYIFTGKNVMDKTVEKVFCVG
jgi:hypothetical protein